MKTYLYSCVVGLLSAVLFTGCLFAPPRYGARGVVTPDSAQYTQYLQNCCKNSSVVNSACQKWGNPNVIKIGNSGGYLVWKTPRMLMSVGAFYDVRTTNRIPNGMLKYLDESVPLPKRNEVRAQAQKHQIAASSQGSEVSYQIDTFERLNEDEFAYAFEITTDKPLALTRANQIKSELRTTVADEYRAIRGQSAGTTIHVDFPEFVISKCKVFGKAVVIQINIDSLRYDTTTHKGVIVVKIGSQKFEDVRRTVRRNIEMIVRDKNIALTTGSIPPEAHFFIGNERVNNGMLEIEFEAQ